MRKQRCRNCKREKAEKQSARQMDSWLCIFDENVWCPHSKVAKSLRFGSVCQRCKHFADFEVKMIEEDERVMNEIDDILRNPEKYGYGGVP
jgi:hypothetical protein